MLLYRELLVSTVLFVTVVCHAACCGGEPIFTPLQILPSPKIISSAQEYPGRNYLVGHIIDDRKESEYASNGKGTDTYIDFDFGHSVPIQGFRHIDRLDDSTISKSELIFSNQRDFSNRIAHENIEHTNTEAATTTVLFQSAHIARFVRWQVTELNTKKRRCLGGSDIRFFRPAASEASIKRNQIMVQAVQAVHRGDDIARRPMIVHIDHVYAEPVDVLLRVGNLSAIPLRLKFGRLTKQVLLPVSKQPQKLDLSIELSGQSILQQQVEVPPVRHWEFHFLAHSHVDIGYTHVQNEVEQKQWKNIQDALEIARKTASYPPEARFKWNTEVLWAVDSYLRQASENEKSEFLQAVRSGSIHLDGLYCNELTALCRPEELMRLTSYAHKISRRYDLPIDAAMISDVPGYTWGTVPALVRNGIKYLSIGPNHIHRIGSILEQWGDRPFYWVSPSGEERLLCWVAGKAYSWFHNSRSGRLTSEPFFTYLDELIKKQSPYDLVQIRYTVGSDNGPPDPQLSEFVKTWNEKYEWPRMVISTTSRLMHTMEDRYGSQIPEVRGDLTPYWEDGAASSAIETAMTRIASERMVQAEALWAMQPGTQYPVDEFYTAWRNILLYNEHTWGAHCSISQPVSPFTVSQWKIKQSFAHNARQQSNKLLEQTFSYKSVANAKIDAVDVWNTTSWKRSNLVQLRTDQSLLGYVVKDLQGNIVPSIRSTDGQLEFMARDIPPLGARRFLLEPGLPKKIGNAKAQGTVLSNEKLRVEVDPVTGAITSLHLDGIPDNLAETQGRGGLNRYSYVAGRIANDLQSNRVTKIEVLEKGGLSASLAIYGQAPGARQLTTILRVIDGIDRVDITNIVDKKNILEKESVHFGFPFQVPGGTMRVNTPWAVVIPEVDQLPGSCKNYLTVGRWVDVSNHDFGVTWTTLDAPLIEVGGIHVDVPEPLSSKNWIKHLDPTQTFYSYVMNNYWETNYKASQEGITMFRYSIAPHRKFDQTSAAKFAIERSQPLLVRPANRKSPVLSSRLNLTGQGVLITSLKPSDDGNALIVRLFNAADKPTQAKLNWPHPVPTQVTFSSLREEIGKPVSGAITMPSMGIVTLRIEGIHNHKE